MTLAAPRALDVLWAATILVWAGVGLEAALADPSRMRIVALGLQLLVAFLLLVRVPARAPLSVRHVGAALPSFGVALVAVSIAPHPAAWLPIEQGLFVAGALLAVVAFAFLGRRFGVLPADRGVVTRGPFALIRHPAYLGEGLMLAAVCAATGGWRCAVLGVAAMATLVLRIHAEESVLGGSRRYDAYRRQVVYRLVPFVW